MAKKSLIKSVGGALTAVFQVIPDTVEVVGKVVDSTVPLVDKALDRHHEHQQSLVKLPDVRDMEVCAAREHLESLGFQVAVLVAKPNRKWRQELPGEVVEMSPRTGRLKVGSLIKLYYMTDEVLKASQQEANLIHVVGLNLVDAQQILTESGFKVVAVVAKPHREYAHKEVLQVLGMDPKPTFLNRLSKGSLVKLTYLDEDGLTQSQALYQEAQNQKEQQAKALSDSLDNLKKRFPHKNK